MEGLRINICERFKQKVTQHKKGENQRENRLGQQIILPQQSSATNPKAHCSHSSIEFWPSWSVLPSVPASPHKTQRSGWKSIKGLCYCQIIFIILLTTFRFQAGYSNVITCSITSYHSTLVPDLENAQNTNSVLAGKILLAQERLWSFCPKAFPLFHSAFSPVCTVL